MKQMPALTGMLESLLPATFRFAVNFPPATRYSSFTKSRITSVRSAIFPPLEFSSSVASVDVFDVSSVNEFEINEPTAASTTTATAISSILLDCLFGSFITPVVSLTVERGN